MNALEGPIPEVKMHFTEGSFYNELEEDGEVIPTHHTHRGVPPPKWEKAY